MGKQQLWIRICHKARSNTDFFWFATDRWNSSIIGLAKGSPELFSPLYTHKGDSQNTKKQCLGRKCLLKSKALYPFIILSKSKKGDWCKMLPCVLLEGQCICLWGSNLPRGYHQSSLSVQRQAAGQRTTRTFLKLCVCAQYHLQTQILLFGKTARYQSLDITKAKSSQKKLQERFQPHLSSWTMSWQGIQLSCPLK